MEYTRQETMAWSARVAAVQDHVTRMMTLVFESMRKGTIPEMEPAPPAAGPQPVLLTFEEFLAQQPGTTVGTGRSSVGGGVGIHLNPESRSRRQPLVVLSGFKSGVTELCACFVRLQWLCIDDCAALVHWPEKEFQDLVSLRNLEILYCKKLVGYAQAPAAEPSATLESSIQLLPSLEFLKIFRCESMVEVFKLPASLRKMEILDCSTLKTIFSRRLQQEQASSSNLQGRPPVYSELSSSSAVSRAEHPLFPCLESIYIRGCHSLTGILDLPRRSRKLKLLFVSAVS